MTEQVQPRHPAAQVLQHVQAVVDEVGDAELVAVERLVAPLQAEPEVIRRDAGRGPELPVIEPAPEAVGWPLTLHFVQLGAGLAIVNAICRLPPRVVSRPIPALPSTHYWLLGKPWTPAMEELARMIRLAAQHRRTRR